MRRLVLIACLLLIAPASAQFVEPPNLVVQGFDVPEEISPGERSTIVLHFAYECSLLEGSDNRRLAFDRVAASSPAVIFDFALTQLVDVSSCRAGSERTVQFDVPIDVLVAEANQTQLVEMRFRAMMEANGHPNFFPASNEAEARLSTALVVREMEPVLEAESQDRAPAEEFAPGPALPLLALGGLAAARLRRP